MTKREDSPVFRCHSDRSDSVVEESLNLFQSRIREGSIRLRSASLRMTRGDDKGVRGESPKVVILSDSEESSEA